MVAARAFPRWVRLRVTSFNARLIRFFRIFLYPFDISLKLLSLSTSYFGYNPRLCFNTARAVGVLETKKEVVMSRIRDVAGKESNISQLLHSTRRGNSDVSHSIFELSPANDKRLLAQCGFGAVSPWALDVLLTEYETQQADAAITFYHSISGKSDAASLRGHVFARQVLNHLNGLRTEHRFLVHGLTSSEEMMWSYRGPVRRFDFLQDLDFIDELTKAVQNEKPLHLVPLARNFAAVDSIIYDPKEVLTFIQIMVNREHDNLVLGLRHIQSWLKHDTPLASLRPSKSKPWRFIFIMPSDGASFELQQLKGNTDQGEWAGVVNQYVLRSDVLRKKPKH